jgi:hypothetical protein
MVRAVQLQNNFSGSYYDPSQGIFVTTQSSTTTSITLTARMAGNGLALTWTSQSGVPYHIQYKDTLQASWTDLPGSGYTASGAITTWVDTTLTSNPQRFYRISSP